MSDPLRVCLFGAAGDTGNLGVSALLHGTLGALFRHAPGAEVTVFDNGWGVREARASYGGRSFGYRCCGARLSRRWHRPESYWNMRVSGFLRGLGNPGMRAILGADAVWDLTGGDSFSDLYGDWRLRAMLAPKRLTLERGVPLVLLPQTYGPFRRAAGRRAAHEVVARARLAWARDPESHAALRELAGGAFDPERHREGVDVAFGLEARDPAMPLEEPLAGWLAEERGARARPVLGLNPSGLLFHDAAAAQRYGLAGDYRALVRGLLERLVERTDARIVLVPHVVRPEGEPESDPAACRALREGLPPAARERVATLPGGLDQSETKALIARLDWFCGTRMHSCIAALSSGVPCAGLAYSLKTRGVFATCGVEDAVAELRTQPVEEALETVWRAWERRAAAAATLAERVPDVRRRADEQMALTVRASARGTAEARLAR